MLIELPDKTEMTSLRSGETANGRAVFITGGNGYIGSRLIERLLKKNYLLIALKAKMPVK